ncbi:MAG: hypothetical protein ACPGRE_02575 [Flavobacteriaceae bacterium]
MGRKALIILSLIGLLSSCDSNKDIISNQEAEQNALDQQYQKILAFVKNHPTTETTVCKSIALGSKACGGPQIYLAYPASIDQVQLEKLVTNYTEQESAFNKKWGITSDCSFVVAPSQVILENGSCKTVYP